MCSQTVLHLAREVEAVVYVANRRESRANRVDVSKIEWENRYNVRSPPKVCRVGHPTRQDNDTCSVVLANQPVDEFSTDATKTPCYHICPSS